MAGARHCPFQPQDAFVMGVNSPRFYPWEKDPPFLGTRLNGLFCSLYLHPPPEPGLMIPFFWPENQRLSDSWVSGKLFLFAAKIFSGGFSKEDVQ
jgi:hypothetical protein